MPYTIWRITDQKAGHDSQSLGLSNAIIKSLNYQCFDVQTTLLKKNILGTIFKKIPAIINLPKPDLIIGAGHKTHIPMLAIKYAIGSKVIVIMKPSLPYFMFDYCLIPKHDNVKESKRIITTFGSLNTIEKKNIKKQQYNLILIGGLSKHYAWNNDKIIKQLSAIVNYKKDQQTIIVGSRRTPEEFYSHLSSINNNIKIFKANNCDRQKLEELIYCSNNIWVTKDSISMIYEALSVGAKVGLIELETNKKNKIDSSLTHLIKNEFLTSFTLWQKTKQLKASKPFNEAQRCVDILLERGALK